MLLFLHLLEVVFDWMMVNPTWMDLSSAVLVVIHGFHDL